MNKNKRNYNVNKNIFIEKYNFHIFNLYYMIFIWNIKNYNTLYVCIFLSILKFDQNFKRCINIYGKLFIDFYISNYIYVT